MSKYYAGIGSRETPPDVLDWMEKIGMYLADSGWTLRSGGADGADSAFEKGCDSVFFGSKEIYLPWKGFNNNLSRYSVVSTEAMELSAKFHPAWNRTTDATKLMMGRNACQVLGEDLSTPSKFILCWTKDGKVFGGTGQAMRIANHYNIHIFNMWFSTTKSDLKQWLEENPIE